jgi:prepilin-type N-terminal cleavage/methylation domain-containing protein
VVPFNQKSNHMNLPNKRHGFTLIELLVVISIIGILASLAIPAVSGALTRGQLTGTLNNARQLHLATQTMDLDNTAAGIGGGWPGSDNTNMDSFAKWVSALTNGYLSVEELRKLMTAQSEVPAQVPTSSPNAFNIYQVGNVENSLAIFITTKNWVGTPTGSVTLPTSASKPYGDKGVVIFRRGGDGAIIQNRFLTNSNSVPIPTNQPALLN